MLAERGAPTPALSTLLAQHSLQRYTATHSMAARTKAGERKRLHTSLVWRMYLVLPEAIRWGDTGNLLFCQYLLF